MQNGQNFVGKSHEMIYFFMVCTSPTDLQSKTLRDPPLPHPPQNVKLMSKLAATGASLFVAHLHLAERLKRELLCFRGYHSVAIAAVNAIGIFSEGIILLTKVNSRFFFSQNTMRCLAIDPSIRTHTQLHVHEYDGASKQSFPCISVQ